jgi:glycerol-3-phosphate acyltransferase PlsY
MQAHPQAYPLLIPLVGYFIGAIPFGALIGKGIAKIDITSRGSGNIGATNVAREVGLKWGILTLALDLMKGFVPVYMYYRYFGSSYPLGLYIMCLAPLLGHQFSPFLGFRGGKGVATALGVFIAVTPIPVLLAIPVFLVTVWLWNYISLGSMIAACSLPLLQLLFMESKGFAVASLAMAALICFKHRDNIQRLFRGEERRWRKKGAMPKSPEADPVPRQNRNGY